MVFIQKVKEEDARLEKEGNMTFFSAPLKELDLGQPKNQFGYKILL